MAAALAAPASTVVLLRQSARGLEVLLVRRDDRVAFMGGAYVFPGGRVEPGDRAGDGVPLCSGADEAFARMPDIAPADAAALHVAAIRELFEEAGVLLARDDTGALVPIHASARELRPLST